MLLVNFEYVTEEKAYAEDFYLDECVTVEMENVKTGMVYETKLLNCTKTVETIDISNGNVRKGITLEGNIEIPPEDDEYEGIPLASSQSTRYDNTKSVKATLYIEYNNGVGWNGYDYYNTYLLERVSGKWEVCDNAVTIYNKTYDVACVNGTAAAGQVKTDISVSDDQYIFDYKTDFDKFVSEEDPTCYIGAAMECYITRSSDEWIFRLDKIILKY